MENRGDAYTHAIEQLGAGASVIKAATEPVVKHHDEHDEGDNLVDLLKLAVNQSMREQYFRHGKPRVKVYRENRESGTGVVKSITRSLRHRTRNRV